MDSVKHLFLALLLSLTAVPRAEGLLSEPVVQPGTPEDHGIITTMALTYAKVRNTVRDVYMSIQYSKAMIATVQEQKRWFERNFRAWKDVHTRVMKVVTEPGQWDQKLIDVEHIFDKTDYLLWEETRQFDHLMRKHELYAQKISGHLNPYVSIGHPHVKEFWDINKQLYGVGDAVPDLPGAKPSANFNWKKVEAPKRKAVADNIENSTSGRTHQATLLAASRAQAQVAAIKRIQKARNDNYNQIMEVLNSSSLKANSKELLTALSDLKAAETQLDQVTMQVTELELMLAHLGLQLNQMTGGRSIQIRQADAAHRLAQGLSKP